MFLSIIVPVYNTEKYLDECLQSLVEQDIPADEYEIICVNDGSTDGSLNILKRFKADNSNIIIIDQKNSGISAARNAGLDAATGDYIWMVDSDDFIQTNSLGEIRKKTMETNCDRLEFGCYTFQSKLSAEERIGYNNKELPINHFTGNIYVWTSLFRRQFIEKYKVRFHSDIYYSEDSLFMIEVNMREPIHVSLEKALYFYRRNNTSVCASRTKEAQQKRLDSYMKVASFLDSYFQGEIKKSGEIADLLMSNLWFELFTIAELPFTEARIHIKELKEKGLYPYKKPTSCTLVKSYQTTRTDFIGKTFDYIYTHMHTRPGFLAMRAWKFAERIKRKIQ